MENSQNEILEKIKEIISNNTDVSLRKKIRSDTDFKNNLSLDYLDLVLIRLEIETEFNITIPDEVYDGISDIKSLVSVVEKYLLENKLSPDELSRWKGDAIDKKAKKIIVCHNVYGKYYYPCYLLPEEVEEEMIARIEAQELEEVVGVIEVTQ